ncbi:hypothetical protein VaNZ11_013066 [Volvox africanus]|uniref:Uncharacterized protein n=1 Tax=Volvox africanus TaxID=51714 RepID=A0ABQ5SFB7_9CHLO|nr:hypothetical protein VaNZ11_013066 [Volvox africanus]
MRSSTCVLMPPSFYRSHVSPLLNTIQRQLVSLYHLVIQLKFLPYALRYLRQMTPIIDIPPLALFQAPQHTPRMAIGNIGKAAETAMTTTTTISAASAALSAQGAHPALGSTTAAAATAPSLSTSPDMAVSSVSPPSSTAGNGGGELTHALPALRTKVNGVQSPSPLSGSGAEVAPSPGELTAAHSRRALAGGQVSTGRRIALVNNAAASTAASAVRLERYRPFSRMEPLAGPYATQLLATANPITSTAAAVDSAGAATAPAVLPMRGYVGRTSLVCSRLKIQGAHPADVPEGYEERIAAVLAASGLQLEGVYIRSGCIELIVDARILGARPRSAAASSPPLPQRARLDVHPHQQSHPGAGRAPATSAADMSCSEQAACDFSISIGGEKNRSGVTSSPTNASFGVSLRGSQHLAKLRTRRSSLSLSLVYGDEDNHNSDAGSSADYSSPVLREVPASVCEQSNLIGGLSPDDNDGSGSDRTRAVDVGELIRALQLPCDGLSLEHLTTFTEFGGEPEVLGPTHDAGAAAPPTALQLEDGSERSGGLVVAEVPRVPLVPLASPQLLSVSPRVLLTRSCRTIIGATNTNTANDNVASTTITNTNTNTTNNNNNNYNNYNNNTRSGGNTASRGGNGGRGGSQHRAASPDTVELVLLVSSPEDERVPELLFRSHGSILPATVTDCVSVGPPASAGGRGLDVLMCTITLPAAMLPDDPGLLLAEVRWEGQLLRGSAVPLLLIDDSEVAGELQAAVEDWRGSLGELEDMLSDLACFCYHARRLRPGAEVAAPSTQEVSSRQHTRPPMLAEGTVGEPLTGVYDSDSYTYDMYDGTPPAVMREQVSELGLHMATWMASCPAGWTRTLARLQTDLASLGVTEAALFGDRSHLQNPQQHQQPLRQNQQYQQDRDHDEQQGLQHQQQHQQHQQQQQERRRRGGGSGSRGGDALEEGFNDNGDDVRKADNHKAATAAGAPVGTGSAGPVLAGNLSGGGGRGLPHTVQGTSVVAAAAPLLLVSSAASDLPGWRLQQAPASVASSTQLQQQTPQYSPAADASLHGTGGLAMTAGYLAGVAAPTAAVAAAIPSGSSASLQCPAGAGEISLQTGGGSSGGGSDPAHSSNAALGLSHPAVTQPGDHSMQAQAGITSSVRSREDPWVGEQAHGKALDPWVISMGLSHSSLCLKPLALGSALMKGIWAGVHVCGVQYSCLMAADYQVFVAEYTIHLTHSLNIFTLSCLLLLAARTWMETHASAAPGGAGLLFLRTMVPPAVSCLPCAVSTLSRPFLSRSAWARLVTLMRLPQLLAFCVAGSLIAWGGFPAAAAIRSFEVGASAFISDGIVHIAASMLLPIPVLLVSLLRMPVHVALWAALGAPFRTRWAAVRAAAVACLSVITSICWHTYLHGVYQWRRWACGSSSSGQQRQQGQQQQQQQHIKAD